MSKMYKVVRRWRTGEREVIHPRLSLAEAQTHCQRADTRGEDWFDAFEAVERTAAEVEADLNRSKAMWGAARRAGVV